MSPEHIRDILRAERPQLHATKIDDGYAFWLGPKAHTNRIIRVRKTSPTASLMLKLAATHRWKGDEMKPAEVDFPFTGGADELLARVDKEIAVYERYLAPKSK